MAHTATDVVRTYEFTDADLMARLGIGGKVVGFGFGQGITRIVTTMIHPEDSRFTAPPVPGEVCRDCGAAPGSPHNQVVPHPSTGRGVYHPAPAPWPFQFGVCGGCGAAPGQFHTTVCERQA